MEFTLVSTVYNEAKRLELTISDLENQSLQPSEIIITDAGSNDGTLKILSDWKNSSKIPIHIIVEPKCNVAEGRNLAIKASKYGIIASTDFGCRFDKDWLKSIIAPFKDNHVMVVGGSFTVKEEEQLTLPAKAAYIINNGYKINVFANNFIPSSRSIAYKKEVFNKVGGYCEWLTLAADDFVFGREIIANKYSINLVDKPLVFWGRHNELILFEKEAFRYGLGDGEAKLDVSSKVKNSIQFLMRRMFFVFFAICFFVPLNINIVLIFLFILSLGFRQYLLYVIKPWIALKSKKYNFKVLLFSFLLFEKTQFNYLKGYLKGYFSKDSKHITGARLLAFRLNQKN